MEQKLSWQANSSSASQETPRDFMEPEGSLPHSQVPANCPISWTTSIQSIPPHHTTWITTLIFSSHLRLGLLSASFPQFYPPKPCVLLIFLPYVPHLILLDLITRLVFYEEKKSYSSSLCSRLHSSVTSSLLGPNIFLSTLFSNNLSLIFPLQHEKSSFTPIQNNMQTYSSVNFNL